MAPVLVGLVAIALIVAAVLFFTSGPGGSGGNQQQNTTVPEVNVGSNPSGGTQAPTTTGKQLTSLPVRPQSSR